MLVILHHHHRLGLLRFVSGSDSPTTTKLISAGQQHTGFSRQWVTRLHFFETANSRYQVARSPRSHTETGEKRTGLSIPPSQLALQQPCYTPFCSPSGRHGWWRDGKGRREKAKAEKGVCNGPGRVTKSRSSRSLSRSLARPALAREDRTLDNFRHVCPS